VSNWTTRSLMEVVERIPDAAYEIGKDVSASGSFFAGGELLLQACGRQLGLTDALIGGIDGRRQSGKIRHAIGDLVPPASVRDCLRLHWIIS
jgi:hypothetical protein